MTTKNTYGAEKITVLKGLEAVRKRPAMYIGDLGQKGLHHLIWEVVDNSIDEAMAGFCTEIKVVVEEDNSITVEDNGRGIPVDIHKEEGKSGLELVMTVLHAGGKFDKDTYKVSGGLHGVGVSVVNALSSKCRAEIHKEGFVYEQSYQHGIAQTEIIKKGKTNKNGTIINFMPDYNLFVDQKFEHDIIDERLRELAYLNSGISVVFKNNKTKKKQNIYMKGVCQSLLNT